MRRLAFSVIGVIAVAAIVIGINMFADARLVDVRADLTQGKIYTLSNGTKQILNELKEPITLQLLLLRPARCDGPGLRHVRRPCPRNAGGIRIRLTRQGQGRTI